MMMNNTLYIVRGIPGAGKSTFAESLGCPYFEADMYFIDPITGEYKWDGSKARQAHEWCYDRVHSQMFLNHDRIAVSNTFTEEWEMEKYFKLAKKYDYDVISLIVENRHNNKNIHNVPGEVILKMKERFNIKL